MYRKYFVSPTFDKARFVDALHLCFVDAKAVDDGIIFDADSLQAINRGFLPHWVLLNRDDMLNPLHSRPAVSSELGFVRDNVDRYEIRVYGRFGTIHHRGIASNLDDLVNAAQQHHKHYYAANTVIIDRYTGEVVKILGNIDWSKEA